MKIIKILAIIFGIYVGIVVAFESLIGYFQPASADTLVITTTDADGQKHDRVLSRLVTDETVYVAVNHWPRAWYGRVLDHPQVDITFAEETKAHLATEVVGPEFERVNSDHAIPLPVRFLMGFAPRRMIRLDPIQ